MILPGAVVSGNYTWAKNISDAQGSDAPTLFASEEPYAVEIANDYNIPYDRGNVVGRRASVSATGTYQLPYGAGTSSPRDGIRERRSWEAGTSAP